MEDDGDGDRATAPMKTPSSGGEHRESDLMRDELEDGVGTQ
ncbi:MAG: hypothetical protein R3B46_05230 [Phycisphaerales bacterium]